MVDSANSLVMAYRTYAHRLRSFLLLGGLLPTIAKNHPNVSNFTSSLTALTSFTMSCVVLNFCWANLKNLAILTKGISLAGSLVASGLKATCFLAKRDRLIELHEMLEEEFEEELSRGPDTVPTFLSLLHTFDRPAYAFPILITSTLLVYFLPSFGQLFRALSGSLEPDNYALPFPGKFPWSLVGGSFAYHLHFLYEFLVAWYLLFTNSGVDALFSFYIFQMASLLRAMSARLRDRRDNEDCAELIRICATKHAKLMHCRDILQDVYGPIILWLVLTNGVIMCALIFQAFQITEMAIGKLALSAFYMFLKILQTFMFAWHGSVLTTEIINTTMSYFFLLQTLDEGN
ncbi:hypothetical protein KM043_010579 [Ampulex compressa]|nr:hypothetical protein KM043_010579 [Ampulex compressa]